MSNDLIANDTRSVAIHSTSGSATTDAATLRPFADADEARTVAGSCRTMLGRHIDPQELADSIAVVLAAKVMDEASGGIGFEAIEGEPRVSASRFDRVVRAALDQLRDATDGVRWPEVEVPELVAHQVLRDLGPYSMLLTAEQPDGGDTLRALFVAAVGADRPAGASVLEDPAVAARLWRLVPASASSSSLGAVASAAASVFLSGDDHVVDLRDGPPSRRS